MTSLFRDVRRRYRAGVRNSLATAKTLAAETGSRFRPAFLRDKAFYLALLAAPVALAILDRLHARGLPDIRIGMSFVLSVVLWQPFIEELLFRGVIQGQLRKRAWGHIRVAGLSVANCLATLIFMLAHLVHHSLWWAAAVIVPSFVFGYFRDRYDQIYPSMFLHAAYNGLYFFAGAQFSGTGIR